MSVTIEQVEKIAVSAATRAAKEAAEQAVAKAALSSRAELNIVVAEAVRQTLIQLGVDISNPLAMQRDFQHLRQWREAGESIKRKSLLTLLGVFFTGGTALLLLGLKAWLQR